MPKATDITGTFRVPEEAWGKFWNLMLSIDGADITPNTRVQPNGARKPRSSGKTSEGTTGICIVLAALSNSKALTTKELSAVLVEAGKSPKSVSNCIFEAKKQKLIKTAGKATYAITPAGRKYAETNCQL